MSFGHPPYQKNDSKKSEDCSRLFCRHLGGAALIGAGYALFPISAEWDVLRFC
jgi:hypothetical protein